MLDYSVKEPIGELNLVMLTQPEEKGKVIQQDKLFIIIPMGYGAELFGDQY